MTRSLISYKNKLAQTENSKEEDLLNEDSDITPLEENIDEN
jgi:hypothetical protein